MKLRTSIHWRSGKGAAFLAGALAVFGAAAVGAQPLLITTLAGYAGQGSADGAGGNALFFNPRGVAVDGAGNVYVADSGNNTIRVITCAGVSSTLAGTAGLCGSADGSGASARFNQPSGIALDSATNIYVSDYGSSTIRQITPSGQVSTIAGQAGVTGSGNATGTNALFFHPLGLAVDAATNLYVADYGNHLVRKITASGVVSTLAGSASVFGFANGTGTAAQFYEPEAVAVDQAGNVYVADTGNAAVRMITAGGVVSTFAGLPGSLGATDGTGSNALFYQPAGIAINSASNLYVADCFNNTVRQISPGGAVITLAGLAGTTGSADGPGSSARFWSPQGVAVNGAGVIYVADTANGTIRRVTAQGIVTTLAGSPSAGSANGASASARFYNPRNVAVDASANIYVADTQNSVIRKITPLGTVSVLAGTPGLFGSADGPDATALFSGPQGVAVDAAGNIYVADTGNDTIRKINASGTVATLAGSAGNPGNADGAGTNAQFYGPAGVAVDNAGNVYVADTWNHTIRKITSAGVSSTLAGLAGTAGTFDGTNTGARFNCPTGVGLDTAANIYVADYNNDTIRKVTPAGAVTTLAGWAGIWGNADGANDSALFSGPAGLSVDNAGNVYVADSGNQTLRKMTPSGTNWVVSTVAGVGGVSGSADGTGSGAEFYYPAGVAVSGAGCVYVADSGNNTIRISTNATLTLTNLPPPQPGILQSIVVLANGTVQLGLSGASGASYTLEVSTNLATWTALATLTMTNVAVQYLDVNATNSPIRFYLLVSP